MSLLSSPQAFTETIAVATGEYAPLVSEKLLDRGVTAAIVTAALRAEGVQADYAFLPWKRGYLLTLSGDYVATFPYLKTPEREAEFLYSTPIYSDRFRLFVRWNEREPIQWTAKSVCIPLGYDTSQVQTFVSKNRIALHQASKIANCVRMLDAGRVDAVWASELVAADTARTLFGDPSRMRATDVNLVDVSTYYIIVSRKLPGAQQWLARFNDGLKSIRRDGTYTRILEKFH